MNKNKALKDIVKLEKSIIEESKIQRLFDFIGVKSTQDSMKLMQLSK